MTSTDFFKLIAQYKFAFAYENTVCDDYVTEKLWRPLIFGVVPLAFGSSKVKDLAPSNHSIIDIRDFRSAKEVAYYLKFLDTHDEEYAKYTEFKRTGITNPTLRWLLDQRKFNNGKIWDSAYDGFQCFVCERLHELKDQIENGQTGKQWSGKADHFNCPSPTLFDENGQFILTSNSWAEDYKYAQYYLQSLRYHIANTINAQSDEIHTYAKKLQKEKS